MAIPTKSDPVSRLPATGAVNHKFSLFAANMAVSRCVRNAKENPNSVPSPVDDSHDFFSK